MYTDSAHPAATLELQQAISECVNGKLFQYYQSLSYSELEAAFRRRGVAISKRNMCRPNKNDLVSTLAHSDDAWVDNAHVREPLPFVAGKDAIFNEMLYNPQPTCNQRDLLKLTRAVGLRGNRDSNSGQLLANIRRFSTAREDAIKEAAVAISLNPVKAENSEPLPDWDVRYAEGIVCLGSTKSPLDIRSPSEVEAAANRNLSRYYRVQNRNTLLEEVRARCLQFPGRSAPKTCDPIRTFLCLSDEVWIQKGAGQDLTDLSAVDARKLASALGVRQGTQTLTELQTNLLQFGRRREQTSLGLRAGFRGAR